MRRGFTLVELIVSLTAGLLVSAAAFLMARNATNFFQHEAGITSAQFSAVVGFSRLQAEIKNASYLSTPNIALDDANDTFCGDVANLPNKSGDLPGMRQLSGIQLLEDWSYDEASTAVQDLWDAQVDAGGTLRPMSPDGIVITGSFDTTEQFSAAAITPDGANTFTVVLNEVNDGATIRTRMGQDRGGVSFTDIFRVGRILRVRDREGRYSLTVIDDLDDNGSNVVIYTSATPKLETKADNTFCGCVGFCVGAPVNVIARMLYDLRTVPASGIYNNLYDTADLDDPGNVTAYHRGSGGQAQRTDLVRVELDTLGAEITETVQIMAEYAVDLEFGATYQDANSFDATSFTREVAGSAGDRYTIADEPVAATAAPPAGRPDLLRSVHIRFSTRAHRRDRDSPLQAMNDNTLYRFNLGPNRGFARMRTLMADVTLPNQRMRDDIP